MANNNLKFRLDQTTGHLYVTYDGCSEEDLGLVKGTDGTNGTDGVTQTFISDFTQLATAGTPAATLAQTSTGGSEWKLTLSHLKGSDGTNGTDGTDGVTQQFSYDFSELATEGTPEGSLQQVGTTNYWKLTLKHLKGADGTTPNVGNRTLYLQSKTGDNDPVTIAQFSANQGANSEGDSTFILEAGDNITLTPDASGHKITIAASAGTIGDKNLLLKADGTTVTTFNANESSANQTLNFIAGDNVTLTPDATNGNITISAANYLAGGGVYMVGLFNIYHALSQTWGAGRWTQDSYFPLFKLHCKNADAYNKHYIVFTITGVNVFGLVFRATYFLSGQGTASASTSLICTQLCRLQINYLGSYVYPWAFDNVRYMFGPTSSGKADIYIYLKSQQSLSDMRYNVNIMEFSANYVDDGYIKKFVCDNVNYSSTPTTSELASLANNFELVTTTVSSTDKSFSTKDRNNITTTYDDQVTSSEVAATKLYVSPEDLS